MAQQYIVDAFVAEGCLGNPAAVRIVDAWPSDDDMLSIACENGLSDTAFVLRDGERYQIRWFTPTQEISLCGHATLASGYVVMTELEPQRDEVVFESPSGKLRVARAAKLSAGNNEGGEKPAREQGRELFAMDFPAYQLGEAAGVDLDVLADALGARPSEVYLDRDVLCVFDSAAGVEALSPDFEALKQLAGLMVHVTAPGYAGLGFDCVSRSFGPKLGADEDPVCGSGHCMIVPYWARRLGKANIVARQASQRGGVLYCSTDFSRVILSGELL